MPAGLVVLPGCSLPVAVPGADDGASPVCEQVLAALPNRLAGETRRDTRGGAGTAAWGEPAILLRCGEDAVVVSDRPCVSVTGPDGTAVDWVVLADGPAGAILRTFGRDPAVEVEVPADYAPAPVNVLPALSAAVTVVPSDSVCLG